MEQLIPIFERDDGLPFVIFSEADIYTDGDDAMLLVDIDLISKVNPDYDSEAYKACIENNKPYDGPDLFMLDWSDFYELYEAQQGKSRFIPKDLMCYLDEEYVEETPQLRAMRRFLTEEVELSDDVDAADLWGEEEDELFEDCAASMALILMNDNIRRFMRLSESIQRTFEELDDLGYVLAEDRIQRFLDLYSDLSNHTRLPASRGFAPSELYVRSPKKMPEHIKFGPGITSSLQSGEFDPEEFKRAILDLENVPKGLKTNMISQVDRAVNTATITGKKDGLNDPCPCCSGKKYK